MKIKKMMTTVDKQSQKLLSIRLVQIRKRAMTTTHLDILSVNSKSSSHSMSLTLNF